MEISELVNKPADSRAYVASDQLVSSSLVGLEVELEGIGRYVLGNSYRYLTAEEDGSLRDSGIELKFSHPYSGQDVISALSELETIIENVKSEYDIYPTLSERTSVHVHVDVRDLTFVQFQRFLILYMIFEKTLFKYCGESRRNNIFCLSFGDAEDVIRLISSLISDKVASERGLFQMYLSDISKYSACNLNAIDRFGSIEFRGHEGEWKSEELLRWINILLSIKEYAINMGEGDLHSLPQTISDDGLNTLFERVFGEYTNYLYYPELTEDILDGIRIAQDAINIVKMQEGIKYKVDKTKDNIFFRYMKKKYPKRYKSYFGGGKNKEVMEEAAHPSGQTFDEWLSNREAQRGRIRTQTPRSREGRIPVPTPSTLYRFTTADVNTTTTG